MNIKDIISKLTLEEKAGLCSGKNYWFTKSVKRLGINSIMFSDGPYGLRKQNIDDENSGVNDSIEAVCFPTGSCSACSFDKSLIKKMGNALGAACKKEGVDVLLGPAINIKRTPICGRNFEYFSEDSYLTGELATSYVNGVKETGVSACPKHFAANNQENRRMTYSSNIDERTLRETYLSAFEQVVKSANPHFIMTSYNKLGGIYCSENEKLLSDILRGNWGYDGVTISDWGGVNDRIAALKAGLDIEMPYSYGVNDNKIIKAVKSGKLDESDLDKTVERILTVIENLSNENNSYKEDGYSLEEQHKLAVKISSKSAVLLKNDNDTLPLNKSQSIIFVGKYAIKPRFQGGGSSHINNFKLSNAYDSASEYTNITYENIYDEYGNIDYNLLEKTIEKVKSYDVCVVFAGLPDVIECEGYDRVDMKLPACQNELIKKITKASKKIAVVLHNGSPIEMPWINDVDAVLEMYLGGQGVGQASADILFGKVNPSGRLAETFPIKMEDNPTFLYHLTDSDEIDYREGIFVGYKYYDKKNMSVLFHFGYGLSYTTFKYDNLKVDIKKGEQLKVYVSVDIKNTGDMDGEEVVQLYISAPASNVARPVRELKGFEKVFLKVGERSTVKFELNNRTFCYYDIYENKFRIEDSEYKIAIGKSSREMVLEQIIKLSGEKVFKKYTVNSTFGDILKDEKATLILKPFIEKSKELFKQNFGSKQSKDAITDEMLASMLKYMPLRGIFSFVDTGLDYEDLNKLIDKLNSL